MELQGGGKRGGSLEMGEGNGGGRGMDGELKLLH